MQQIINTLNQIEKSHNVSILYAAESGSRAWGFASENSDYDVRFLYCHPLEHYLSFDVELKRDVIEETVKETDLDVRGWGIRKTLHLFTRSNGALLEWLRSPICYREPHASIKELTELAEHAFNPTALMFHYYRTAKNNAREFLRGNSVSLKKYLYVVRCLVAVDWVRERLELPAVNFGQLLNATSLLNSDVAEMRDAAYDLINRKRNALELGTGKRVPELDTYIQQALGVNEKAFENFRRDDLRQRKWDTELNAIFRSAIGYKSQ